MPFRPRYMCAVPLCQFNQCEMILRRCLLPRARIAALLRRRKLRTGFETYARRSQKGPEVVENRRPCARASPLSVGTGEVLSMLGPPKVRDLMRPVVLSLDSAVPKTHFYR